MAEADQRLIVITINGYRKPGLTEEELHHRLCEVHAPKAKHFLEKYGILEYNVVSVYLSNIDERCTLII
jgi:hypothetical protein